MSNGVKELRSLPLFEIIGAPLIAIVQAQAQAARATVEFIEKVGFVEEEASADAEVKVGALRMAEFNYVKPDENGERGVIERLLAAWHYLTSPHRKGLLADDPKRRDECRAIGERLASALLDTEPELAREIDEQVQSLNEHSH